MKHLINMYPKRKSRSALLVHLFTFRPIILTSILLVGCLCASTEGIAQVSERLLVLSSKSKHQTTKLDQCEQSYLFLSDTISTTYQDRFPRNSIYTICPRYPQQRVTVSFETFDLKPGDSLFVYNGFTTDAPLLDVASGQGVEAAFGGSIASPYSREENPTSCLTFQLRTNADEIAGVGWVATAQCVERVLTITIPHIPPQQFVCMPSFATVTINPATVFSLSGPIENDSTLVRVRDGITGDICLESVLSLEANTSLNYTFGIGMYVVEYISLLDPSVKGSTRFEVIAPVLTCKESPTVTLSSNCALSISVEQLIEAYCPTQNGVFHYNLTVKDASNQVVVHGTTLEEQSLVLSPNSVCNNDSYLVEIQKEFTNTSLSCASSRIVQFCTTTISINNQLTTSFNEPAQIYTLHTCDVNLSEVLNLLPTPSITSRCGTATAQIESTSILNNANDCAKPTTYLITWKATDNCGQTIRRSDTLQVRRPIVNSNSSIEIFTVFCEDFEEGAISNPPFPTLLTGLTINDQFQSLGSFSLSATQAVCDYELTLKETIPENKCDRQIIRYWALTDLCNTSALIPLDTQIIQIIDTLAPTIQCTAHTTLADAEEILLPVNSCQVSLSFPLPRASNNCNDIPIVREFTFERLVNGEWSPQAISLLQTGVGVGTYRLGYQAVTECSKDNLPICFRFFIVKDNTIPVTRCQEISSIQLGINGTAVLTAADLNNASSDNCGITQLSIRRSLCTAAGTPEEPVINPPIGAYASQVFFDCCDIGRSVQVELLAVDASGNSSICQTQITSVQTTTTDAFSFTASPQTYTLIACDFDLLPILGMLPVPSVEGVCGGTAATIETTLILAEDTQCENQTDFLIIWQATADNGTIIRRTDTLKIERPSLIQATPSQPVTLVCKQDISSFPASSFPLPSLLTGLIIDGQFRPLDTIQLSVTAPVCDFELSSEIIGNVSKCNEPIQRIWTLKDLCAESPIAIPFDTQQVVLLDTIAPLILCTAFNSLENREVFALSATACATAIAFPLPNVTDNCTTQPLINEFTVEALSNNNWIRLANTLADISFSRGIYRVGYSAIDDCGNTSNVNDCYRYFEVIDTALPIAACLPNIVIQLENDGTAIITSEAINGNSTDNCSIANITIRRTSCNPTESPAEAVSTTGTFGAFSTQLTFDCCDVGKTALVEMRVEDESGNVSICQTQVSQIEARDTDIFAFVDPIQTYTLAACNFDLVQILNLLPSPAITGLCEGSAAQIESTSILTANTQCDDQSDFIITWQATDNFGNSIRRADTLKIERPSIAKASPNEMDTIFCTPANFDPLSINTTPPSLVTGLTIKGQFQALDTIFLSLGETICDFQLTYNLDTLTSNCAAPANGIWLLTDLCNTPTVAVPIDTQEIQFLDTIAPALDCSAFGSVDNPVIIPLPVDACLIAVSFPLPTASDNCDEQPVVRESSVEILISDNNWSTITNTLASISFGRGTYRVSYTAIDNCGNSTNPTDCFRHFRVIDNSSPIAACQADIVVQLEDTGTATLSVESVNVNSSDNCGIENISIRRSLCSTDDQPAESNGAAIDFGDYGQQILFDCCDVGSVVQIDMRVEDEAGNVSTCRTQVTQIEARDTDIFNFAEPAQAYSLTACNFDLLNILAVLPVPAVAGLCGASAAQIETTALLDNDASCDNQSDFLIVWQATDDLGNTIRRTDTLKIERPSILPTASNQLITVSCEEDLSNPTIFPIAPPRLASTLTVGGQMRTLEEVVLSLTETVCDYQLMVEIDEASVNCDGLINRIWSVRDLCAASPIAIPFDTQQVVLLDTIIPLIVCTAFNSLENRETIALSPTTCATTIAFPLPTATDNCTTQPLISEFSVETLSNNTWTKIANTLADISFSRGIYRVGYFAVDECGNTTNVNDCYRYFEVIDNTFPIAVCLPNVVVQLENNGTATVTSEAFNGNSTDNCSIANITIRRTTCDPTESPAESVSTTGTFGAFSTQITFDCCDIGKTVLVEMSVEDESGNVSVCQTQVSQIEANDTDIFNFIEPAQAYFLTACDFDLLSVLAVLPIPAVAGICGASAAQLETTALLDDDASCDNQSDFLIVWQATDDLGTTIRRTDTLKIERPSIVPTPSSQLITVSCEEDLSNTTIFPIAPPRLISTLTVGGQIRALEDVVLSLTETVCDYQLMVKVDDASVNCDGPINRIWSVLDLCEDSALPIVIDTQQVELMDSIAPVIDCTEFTTVDNPQVFLLPVDACQTIIVFSIPDATDDCDPNPIVREFAIEQLNDGIWTSVGVNLSTLQLGPGIYRVGYEALDNCKNSNNRSICYRHFSVVDNTLPTASCRTDLTIELNGAGTATLEATAINNNSSDNCGIKLLLAQKSTCESGDQRSEIITDTIPGIDLREWFPTLTLECCDLTEETTLELLVVDSFDNFSICQTTIKVNDPILPSCTPLSPASATCQEYEVTDLGRPTDRNENGEFEEAEWLPININQLSLYNTRFGNALNACTDNVVCVTTNVEQQYQLIEGICGTIDIKRRYRAVDFAGNFSPWLEQIITITYQPDWTLVLPADAMTNCEVTKIEDPSTPIQNGICDDLVWNFRDSLILFENGSIREICRTFSIVNRCLSNNMDEQWTPIPRPENEQGVVLNSVIVSASTLGTEDHLTYVQKIRLIDTEAPFLVVGEVDLLIRGKGDEPPFGEEDQQLGSPPFECDEIKEFTAFARDCNEPSTLAISYEWEFFSNGQVLENGTGNNFQQIVVPDSIYAVHWSATDPFGNQSDTTITYQFMDGTPPTTICTKGLEVIVDGTTMDVIITTDSLNDGTFDNCDDQLELGLFLWHESMMVDTPQTIDAINQLPDSVLFNCVDTGAVTILLYSTDQSGNFSSCASTIQIIENPEIECDETMLTGTIANRFGQPINGATIEVTGNKEQLLLTSNEAGRYEQMLPMHRPYTIRPYLQKHPLNGVSTYDIILLSKHIIGEQLFESPYQYIAADINRSGHVTVFDAVQLRQLILNKIQDFPNNTSWRFINADYTFQTKQPLTEAFPESYDYQSLTPEQLDMDFVGVKIGDISGDADTHNLTPHTQLRNTRTTVFIYTNPLKVEKGKTYQIVINAPNWRDIIGFQTTFKFHDLILTNFTGGMVTSEQTHGWQEGQEGFLTISCNSNSLLSHDNHTSRLFTLTVKATKDGALQELLTLASSPTPTEVYSLSGNQLGLQLRHFYPIPEKLFPGFVSTPLSISAVGLPSNSESGVFELFQNYPNPFTETTTIKFHLPKAAITALSLFDIHGQTILQTQQHYETGTHTILLNSDQLTSGAYFYQVATPFGVATKKMMIVK